MRVLVRRSDPDFVTDHAATVFDELGKRTHRWALRSEGVQLVAMREQQVELEFGIGGIVFGPAGGKGFAIPRQHERIDGEEDEKVIRAQGGNQGAFVEFEADGNRLAVEPPAQRGDPRVNGLGGVLNLEALPFGGASHLEAPIMFTSAQSIPIKAAKVSCDGGVMRHLPECVSVATRDMRADVLRRHYREPVARQTLSIR